MFCHVPLLIQAHIVYACLDVSQLNRTALLQLINCTSLPPSSCPSKPLAIQWFTETTSRRMLKINSIPPCLTGCPSRR
uniref:Putative secreted protein n=1 Tax=Anopheles darlingi TaxID=43151 RepID=A0A2M4D8N2_ANODA